MSFNNEEYKLVSSNKGKIAEFRAFGLKCSVEKGKDLDEVDSNPVDIAIYKAKEVGSKKIIEDTTLQVEGFDEFGVIIKWKIGELGKAEGAKAEWIVMLGVNDGEYIHVFEGKVKGVIKSPESVPKDAFGFDPFFVPEGENETLYTLKQLGRKDEFSARKKAVDKLLENKPIKSIKISDVSEWTGDWQN